MIDTAILWDKCLDDLRYRVKDNVFTMWLRPLSVHKEAQTLVIRAPNDYFVTYIKKNHLADIEQLDQAAAADSMEISRPTFHRIVNRAHQKIASALWQGQALRVDGGKFRVAHQCQTSLRHCLCRTCGHKWSVPHGTGQRCHDLPCPSCQNLTVSRNREL